MNVIDMARGVFEVEIEALKAIGQRIDGEFERAIELILEARGRVVVVGMGKSGIIGKKIAATPAPPCPALFLCSSAAPADRGVVGPCRPWAPKGMGGRGKPETVKN